MRLWPKQVEASGRGPRSRFDSVVLAFLPLLEEEYGTLWAMASRPAGGPAVLGIMLMLVTKPAGTSRTDAGLAAMAFAVLTGLLGVAHAIQLRSRR